MRHTQSTTAPSSTKRQTPATTSPTTSPASLGRSRRRGPRRQDPHRQRGRRATRTLIARSGRVQTGDAPRRRGLRKRPTTTATCRDRVGEPGQTIKYRPFLPTCWRADVLAWCHAAHASLVFLPASFPLKHLFPSPALISLTGLKRHQGKRNVRMLHPALQQWSKQVPCGRCWQDTIPDDWR